MLAEVENADLLKLCHYQKHVVRNLFTYLIQFSSPNSSLSMLNSSNSHITIITTHHAAVSKWFSIQSLNRKSFQIN